MDDPVSLPVPLRTRPSAARDSAPRRSRVFDFDLARQCAPDCPRFAGVHVFRDFLDPEEAERLLREIEQTPFVPAQSGKLKQHFGAKVNFNKRRVNLAGFAGLPDYVGRIEERLRDRRARRIADQAPAADGLDEALDGFEATDAFVLRYEASHASNLDLHRDDVFAYGEAILDLSLQSDSVLSFVDARAPDGSSDRTADVTNGPCLEPDPARTSATDCVRVPLPARSLAVLYGPARFDWEHGILAYDVEGRRTSVTLRTPSDVLRDTEVGRQLLSIARRRSTEIRDR